MQELASRWKGSLTLCRRSGMNCVGRRRRRKMHLGSYRSKIKAFWKIYGSMSPGKNCYWKTYSN